MVRTAVGYAGGTTPHPTYQRMGDHTESVEIEFDPARISYEDLLEEFWSAHDATRPAYSVQYRSVIFYRGEEQRHSAMRSRERYEREHGRAVETALEPAGTFTRAEDYHQKYRLRGDRDLFREFRAMYGDGPALADSTAAARVNGMLDGFGSPAALDALGARLGLTPRGLDHLSSVVTGRSAHGFRTRCG